MSRILFDARWIMPVSSPPIENGRLVIENGRIVSIDRAAGRDRSAIDLGDAIVLPGLVNAHTHLELTACRGRVPYRGSFVDWIEQLTIINPHNGPDDLLEKSIGEGFKQSITAGVTTLADIGAGPYVLRQWSRAPINTVGFLEVLGVGPMLCNDHLRSFGKVTELFQSIADVDSGENLKRVGISPHAPYSTDISIYREAVHFVGQTGRHICTHLAETREELQFLSDGTGPLRDLLERFGLWDGSFEPPGCSPVEYVRQLGLLEHDPLLVHVNYVDDKDLGLLAEHQCSIAFCPRSQRYFEHEPHRYREMLARGINVCIGTDSLASNDSLSVLDELRFLRSQDQKISNRQLLEMGTIAGAGALKSDGQIGTLESGKKADLAVVPLNNPATTDPVDDLLTGESVSSSVYVSGKRIYPN
ncbi:MAG: amidohydrolase family protein [Planctomycetota bacterium]|nr:MAG: amidohydrolase family protein [Planctomycetota bacterium]